MEPYLDLLQTILDEGVHKPAARENMPGTQSRFGHQFRHDLAKGFPILTTKKMPFKGIVTELLWFLNGDTNIKFLDDAGVRYMWHEDAYNYYCKVLGNIPANQIFPKMTVKPLGEDHRLFTFEEFCAAIKGTDRTDLPKQGKYTLGDCGYQYGRVWRKWDFHVDPFAVKHTVDQIKTVITSLRQNPEGRRHIVTAIDPTHDTDLALYWCHAMVQFNCRPLTKEERVKWLEAKTSVIQVGEYIDFNSGKDYTAKLDAKQVPKYYLDCQLYQRSADVVLGVPFNIASYALLTEIFAKMCNMIPGEFIHTFGDVHIYDNHKDAVKENLSRTPGKLPQLDLVGIDWSKDIDNVLFQISQSSVQVFNLLNYEPQGKIEAELSTGLVKK